VRTLPLTEARKELSKLLDEVASAHEHVTITRQGRPAAVVMSADEFESWQETLEVLSEPETMASLKRAERDIKAGRVTPYAKVRKRPGR
jgi:antitoxin YefM